MGIFFKDKPKVAVAPKSSAVAPASQTFFNSEVQSPLSGSNVAGEDFTKHLDDVLDKANIAGPDFYEFSKALQAISGQPLTEAQKYITTFASFTAMGITPQKLMEAASFYINRLEEERKTFSGELANARRAKVDDKKTEVTKLQDENTALAKRIEENSAKMASLGQQIIANTTKLTANEMSFNQACDVRVQTITNQIQNIKTYLTDGQSTK